MIWDWITENSGILLFALGLGMLVLFILCIILFVKLNNQTKRYDLFTGSKRRPSQNLEMKIEEYYLTSKAIEEKYGKLLDMVSDMDSTMRSNIQKVGIIRYNPFDEMGGNLCFALALLDGEDNGVVINGIHSRTGSFTYAKPIALGVSTYMLSDEELRAVEMAKEQAYQPQHAKVVKVKFKPTFRRKDKEMVMEEQISLPDVETTEKEWETQDSVTSHQDGKAKEKTTSNRSKEALGDVTEEEKKQISQESSVAERIASADTMFPRKEKKDTLPKQGSENLEEFQEEHWKEDLLEKTLGEDGFEQMEIQERDAPIFIKRPDYEEE